MKKPNKKPRFRHFRAIGAAIGGRDGPGTAGSCDLIRRRVGHRRARRCRVSQCQAGRGYCAVRDQRPRSARPTLTASTRRFTRPPVHLPELPGRPYRQPLGDHQDQSQAAVEDRLHRFRDHQPVQRRRPDRAQAAICDRKERGPRQGSLYTNIPATSAESTPEEQISAIEQMVREGVNAIIILPVDSVSETPAMNAAGKAGVPVILADTPPALGSIYPVPPGRKTRSRPDAGALGIIQKRQHHHGQGHRRQ